MGKQTVITGQPPGVWEPVPPGGQGNPRARRSRGWYHPDTVFSAHTGPSPDPSVTVAFQIRPVGLYQFIQTAPDTMEVRLAMDRELTEKEKLDLSKRVEKNVDYAFTLEFNCMKEIPRTKGGKYEDFRSDIV